VLRRAVGPDWKGRLSSALYVLAIVLARWVPSLAELIFVSVALMWLVPDRRIERALPPKGGEAA